MAIEIYTNICDTTSGRILLYSTIGNNDYHIIPGIIKSEFNKSQSFEFDIYNDETSEYFHYFLEGDEYITVEDTNFSSSDTRRYMFCGRVATVEVDLSGKMHVVCEGRLSNLMDFPVYMPTSSSGGSDSGIWRITTADTSYLFRYALSAYIEGLGRHDIRIGDISGYNVISNEDGWFDFKEPWSQSVGDFIMSELVNQYGGLLTFDYWYDSTYGVVSKLNWIADPISLQSNIVESQQILYGDNVLEASIETQSADFTTGIFAVGKDKDDSNAVIFQQWYNDDTNHYVPWVNYGEKYRNDSVKTVNFDNAHTISDLNSMAEKYVAIYCQKRPSTVKAKVIDKYYLGEYGERITVMKKYHVEIPFVGKSVDEDLYCLSSEIDISNPANNSYVFGPYIPQEMLKRSIFR